MTQTFTKTCLLVCLFASSLGFGVIDRLFMVDLGGGLPQLLGAEVAILATPRMQLGVGYGILPGGINFGPEANWKAVSVSLKDGTSLSVAPDKVSITLHTLSPFYRIFIAPELSNFYLQLSFAILQTRSTLSTAISSQGIPIPGMALKGKATFTELLPTISIGNVFRSELFFINFSMGITYLASVSGTADVDANFGDIQANTENQPALDSVRSQFNTVVDQATSQFKKQTVILPSIQVSAGFLF